MRVGVDHFEQHALGLIEVVADDDEEDLVGFGLIGDGRHSVGAPAPGRACAGGSANAHTLHRPLMPQNPAEEGDDQHGRRGESDLPVARAPALAAELPAQARPHFFAVMAAALGDGHGVDEREHARERLGLRAALRARAEVLLDVGGGIAVVVVVQDELFFGQVLHGFVLTRGSSDSRSLRTARKMVCFAALTWMPSVLPISSTGMPSKWRSTNAVRSLPDSRCMAALTCSCSSDDSSSRSCSASALAAPVSSASSGSPP